jgi:hypothetical protein
VIGELQKGAQEIAVFGADATRPTRKH